MLFAGHNQHHLFSLRLQINFDPNYDCESLTGLEGNWMGAYCRQALIHYRIKVGLRDFEAALVNAVDHAGYRIRFRGMKPHRDNSTATGWKV